MTNSAIKLVYENEGFKLDGFTDPLLALSASKANQYDILLLDIQMPGMDGLELCERIKKIDKLNKYLLYLLILHMDYLVQRQHLSSSFVDCLTTIDRSGEFDIIWMMVTISYF